MRRLPHAQLFIKEYTHSILSMVSFSPKISVLKKSHSCKRSLKTREEPQETTRSGGTPKFKRCIILKGQVRQQEFSIINENILLLVISMVLFECGFPKTRRRTTTKTHYAKRMLKRKLFITIVFRIALQSRLPREEDSLPRDQMQKNKKGKYNRKSDAIFVMLSSEML